MTQIDRRRFLKSTLLAAGGIFLAPIIESCKDDDLGEFIPAPSGLQNQNFN